MALVYFIPDLKGSYLILSLQKGIIGYYLLSSSFLLFALFGVWWGSPHLSSSGYTTWLWWGYYSSRIFDGDMVQSTSFNSGGAQLLMELSFWWRFLFTQLQLCPVVGISLLLLLLLCSSVRCGGALVWHRPLTQLSQCSRLGP